MVSHWYVYARGRSRCSASWSGLGSGRTAGPGSFSPFLRWARTSCKTSCRCLTHSTALTAFFPYTGAIRCRHSCRWHFGSGCEGLDYSAIVGPSSPRAPWASSPFVCSRRVTAMWLLKLRVGGPSYLTVVLGSALSTGNHRDGQLVDLYGKLGGKLFEIVTKRLAAHWRQRCFSEWLLGFHSLQWRVDQAWDLCEG